MGRAPRPVRSLALAGLAVLASACGGGGSGGGAPGYVLPAGLTYLETGFTAEEWQKRLSAPDKIAFAPDGRLFFDELSTGNVRVIDATGTLLAAPFATIAVLAGNEQGLLGIAFAPDFATSGHVYVYATLPAGNGHADRNAVLRLTANPPSANTGGSPTVIVDDLPTGPIHNSGNVAFGPDGMLYVSVGDTSDASLSQDDASLAGRILRYDPAGGIPAGNPIAGSPEWCRGLRNTFDFTFHPTAGTLIGSENGPTFQDEVNLIRPGMNYEWPTLPAGVPGSQIGHRITQWTPVIAPTGIVYYTGGGFGAGYDDNLFLCGYVNADLRRLAMSGPLLADLDSETMFATWVDTGSVANKPLDIALGPDGRLYVSTFTSIWRFSKAP